MNLRLQTRWRNDLRLTQGWPISDIGLGSIVNQRCYIGVGSAATARTKAIEALAVLQEVAEGNQSHRVGVHGQSMMRHEARGTPEAWIPVAINAKPIA